MLLNKHDNSSHEQGGIAPLFDISTVVIAAAPDLKKKRSKLTCHWWGKKEYNFPFSGGGITYMEVTQALKNQKQITQKDGGSSPVGDIAYIIVDATLRKDKKQDDFTLVGNKK